MAEDTVSAPSEGRSVATRESESASKPVRRRRASRAAGPASGTPATGVSVEAPTPVKVRGKPGPPPRRQPNRTLVATVALATAFVAAAVTGLFAWLAFDGNRHM
jgi:Mce-associated membrane protein